MAKMNRNGYREQKACANCKHVFFWYDYDSEERFYCTLGAEKRPPCGSVCLGEGFFSSSEVAHIKRKEWFDWAEANEVEPNGICCRHEQKDA